MTEDDKRELKDAYVSLYTHFNVLLNEREKRMDDRFAAAREALELARSELREHLKALNNHQSTLKDERTLFVRQEVYTTKTEYYDAWCRGVDKKFAYWGGGLAVLIFLLEFIFRYVK